MIRTKGEPGTGDVVQAVRHMRAMNAEIRRVQNLREDELYEAAKQLQVPVDLLRFVHENGKLPVVNFAAGGVATPADAALMMQLGAEGVFVGSGIFKSGNPAKRAAAIVQSVTNFTDAKLIAKLSKPGTPVLRCYNKADLVQPEDIPVGEDVVAISARQGKGMEELLHSIEKALGHARHHVLVRLPYSMGGMVETLHNNARVGQVDYSADGIEMDTILDDILYGRLRDYVVKEL